MSNFGCLPGKAGGSPNGLEFPRPTGNGELVLFEGPNGSGKTTIVEAIATLIGRDQQGHCPTGVPGDRTAGRIGKDGRISCSMEHLDGEGTLTTDYLTSNRSSWTMPGYEDDPTLAQVGRAINSYLLADRTIPPIKLEWAAFMYGPHGPTEFNKVEGPGRTQREAIAGSLSMGTKSSYTAGHEMFQLLVNLENERARNFYYSSLERDDADYRLRVASSAQDSRDRLRDALTQILGRSVEFDYFNDEKNVRILLDGRAIEPKAWGEGLRSTLAWLTDLLVRLERIQWDRSDMSPWDQEFWLLLDEIEESLHPKRQMEILPAIRKLFPNAHIYATTHSPFVVASVGEGHVFSIRPDSRTRRVSGTIQATELRPGQSLEWIISEIFDTPSGFVNKSTVEALGKHKSHIGDLGAGKSIDWAAFLSNREWLMALNEEISTIVLMREVRLRKTIDAEIDKRR